MAAPERLVIGCGFILLNIHLILAQTGADITTQATLPSTTAASGSPAGEPAQTVNPNEDLAICTCDLLAGACDVNCCCDPDCTPNDLNAFTRCDDVTTPPNLQTCVQSSIIFRANVPFTINETVPGLFCIERDNYESRNFFTVPELIDTQDMFNDFEQRYGSFSFAPPSVDGQLRDTSYRSGEEIYTVYESGNIGVLSQPAPQISAQCVDTNPAAFLFSLSRACVRRISNIYSACETMPELNAQTYYQGFKIVSTPEVFAAIFNNDTGDETTTEEPAAKKKRRKKRQALTTPTINGTGTEISFDEIVSLYNSSYAIEIIPQGPFTCIGVGGENRTCDFDVVPAPTLELNATQEYVCRNTLAQITYEIETNGTAGVLTAIARLVFRDLYESDMPINQVFATEFTQPQLITTNVGNSTDTRVVRPGDRKKVRGGGKAKLDQDLTFIRSGNPGYLVGDPILAGQLIEQEQQPDLNVLYSIQLNSDRDNWLTMVTSGVGGMCSTEGTGNRVPVTFGENMRSGCFIRLTYNNMSDLCGMLNPVAFDALVGPDPPTYTATFGNSNPETVGDWVQIFGATETPTASNPANNAVGVCENVLVGMTVQIVYANVGALGNPQPQVIGASFQYQYQPQVRFQCMGAYCQPGNGEMTQKLQVVSAVDFIDASDPAQGVSAERPSITASLPEDFFYPFT